ncbi:hypothetical protein VTI74DRAFT_8987 [Chaetomium olivicolor]
MLSRPFGSADLKQRKQKQKKHSILKKGFRQVCSARYPTASSMTRCYYGLFLTGAQLAPPRLEMARVSPGGSPCKVSRVSQGELPNFTDQESRG